MTLKQKVFLDLKEFFEIIHTCEEWSLLMRKSFFIIKCKWHNVTLTRVAWLIRRFYNEQWEQNAS